MHACRGVQRDEYGNVVLGDVIVGVRGQRVSTVEELVACVEQFSLGDQVPISLHRCVHGSVHAFFWQVMPQGCIILVFRHGP
jgi:hypothetical protein